MFNDWSWKQLALPALLVLAVLINKSLISPGVPKSADADPASFSAIRAMDHVRWIAAEPHAVGTPANKLVRDKLVARLKASGLEVEVQSAQVLDRYRSLGKAHNEGLPHHQHSAAYIENVIGRLRGTGQKGKALLLMSHYDSVYYGPGAGDAAAGTSTLLETLRAIQAGEPLENDVIFLLTDAEEVGLFGAQAFFEKHRWANDVGLVLNFEARGSKGPVSMFQTGRHNNQQLKVYAGAVDRPFANSLTVTIYRNMPNDTDMSISLKDNIPGMNFAFIEGFYDYHTKGDNPDNLNPATLQHMGDQALAMTRMAGNQTLPLQDTSEVVFFDFLMLFMISYPLWASWIVATLAIGALVLLAKDKAKAGKLSLAGMFKGALAALFFIIGFALIVDALFLIIGGRSGDFVEGRRLFALANAQLLAFSLIGFGFALAWFRMVVQGFSALWLIGGLILSALLFVYETNWVPAVAALALTGIAYVLFRSPISSDERLFSSLDIYLLAALMIQFVAPSGSYLFLWPFLFLIAGLYLQANGKAGLGLISILALLGALWLSYFTEMGYSALGISLPSVIAVPFGLLLLMLVPSYMHVTRNSHRTVTSVSLLAGLFLIVYAGLATGFTERLNQPTEAFYVVDSKGDGRNHFATRLKNQDDWSNQIMTGEREDLAVADFLPNANGMIQLTAAPTSTVEKLSVVNASRSTTRTAFTLKPGYRGDIIILSLESSAAMTEIRISGEPLERGSTPPDSIMLYYFAAPTAGVPFDIETTGDISIHASEITSDWPLDIAAQIPQKPENIMRAPYRLSDSTISSVKQVIPAGE